MQGSTSICRKANLEPVPGQVQDAGNPSLTDVQTCCKCHLLLTTRLDFFDCGSSDPHGVCEVCIPTLSHGEEGGLICPMCEKASNLVRTSTHLHQAITKAAKAKMPGCGSTETLEKAELHIEGCSMCLGYMTTKDQAETLRKREKEAKSLKKANSSLWKELHARDLALKKEKEEVKALRRECEGLRSGDSAKKRKKKKRIDRLKETNEGVEQVKPTPKKKHKIDNVVRVSPPSIVVGEVPVVQVERAKDEGKGDQGKDGDYRSGISALVKESFGAVPTGAVLANTVERVTQVKGTAALRNRGVCLRCKKDSAECIFKDERSACNRCRQKKVKCVMENAPPPVVEPPRLCDV